MHTKLFFSFLNTLYSLMDFLERKKNGSLLLEIGNLWKSLFEVGHLKVSASYEQKQLNIKITHMFKFLVHVLELYTSENVQFRHNRPSNA
jgi:hypothetical protein